MAATANVSKKSEPNSKPQQQQGVLLCLEPNLLASSAEETHPMRANGTYIKPHSSWRKPPGYQATSKAPRKPWVVVKNIVGEVDLREDESFRENKRNIQPSERETINVGW